VSFKLIDDPSIIIYDRNRVIIQATGHTGYTAFEAKSDSLAIYHSHENKLKLLQIRCSSVALFWIFGSLLAIFPNLDFSIFWSHWLPLLKQSLPPPRKDKFCHNCYGHTKNTFQVIYSFILCLCVPLLQFSNYSRWNRATLCKIENKLIEGSSEKVDTRQNNYKNKNIVIINIAYCFNLSAVLKIHFFSIKQKILFKIDFSNILNCVTFSVAPSIINDNEKYYVPLAAALTKMLLIQLCLK
jgi:hypothetical protein